MRRTFVLNGAVTANVTRFALDALTGIGDVSPAIVHNRVVFAEAATAGESVLTLAPGSPAALEIDRLFQHVASEANDVC